MAHIQTNIRPDVGTLVFDAETDMRKVKDLALLLHDQMAGTQGISSEMQGALAWLTGELLEIGERLNQRFDNLHAAAKAVH